MLLPYIVHFSFSQKKAFFKDHINWWFMQRFSPRTCVTLVSIFPISFYLFSYSFFFFCLNCKVLSSFYLWLKNMQIFICLRVNETFSLEKMKKKKENTQKSIKHFQKQRNFPIFFSSSIVCFAFFSPKFKIYIKSKVYLYSRAQEEGKTTKKAVGEWRQLKNSIYNNKVVVFLSLSAFFYYFFCCFVSCGTIVTRQLSFENVITTLLFFLLFFFLLCTLASQR